MLEPAELTLNRATTAVQVFEPFGFARDQRMQSVGAHPHRAGLASPVATGDSEFRQSPPVKQVTVEHDMREIEGWMLRPGGFVLGSTIEWVNIPNDLVCRIEGKSSLARPGLQIHSAGFIDPGFQGNITLEITNFGPDLIWLWPDVLIAQLCFERLHSPCRTPYEGRYQRSEGVVDSRYNWEVEKAT